MNCPPRTAGLHPWVPRGFYSIEFDAAQNGRLPARRNLDLAHPGAVLCDLQLYADCVVSFFFSRACTLRGWVYTDFQRPAATKKPPYTEPSTDQGEFGGDNQIAWSIRSTTGDIVNDHDLVQLIKRRPPQGVDTLRAEHTWLSVSLIVRCERSSSRRRTWAWSVAYPLRRTEPTPANWRMAARKGTSVAIRSLRPHGLSPPNISKPAMVRGQ